MSLENNRKIFLGSVIYSLDRRKILGDTINSTSLILLGVLTNFVEYCTNQYNATQNEEFLDKIKVLNKLIHKLKYECSDVCIYKDEYY